MQMRPLTPTEISGEKKQIFFADGFIGSLRVVNDYAICGCPVIGQHYCIPPVPTDAMSQVYKFLIKRRVFTVSAVICAVLAIAVLWMQSRSDGRYEFLQYAHKRSNNTGFYIVGVGSCQYVLFVAGCITRANVPPPNKFGLQAGSWPSWRISRPPGSALYPGVVYNDPLALGTNFTAWVPHWLAALCLGLLPAVWLCLYIRLRRRMRLGRCGSCGYDLSYNVTGRCPECGLSVESA
jgi:hypothetical protein